MPNGDVRAIDCHVARCRPIVPGWYEAALVFRHKHSELAIENLIVCQPDLA